MRRVHLRPPAARAARAAIALLALTAAAPPAPAASPSDALARVEPSPELRRQLEALRAEKRARVGVERKLSSRLLFEIRRRRGERAVAGLHAMRGRTAIAADGTTLVEVRVRRGVSLRAPIESLGGELVHEAQRSVVARLPIDRVRQLAERNDVRFIRPFIPPITRMIDTSEGDVAHRADALRTQLGVDGSGVTIGVLSDGVDSLAARQATGDLPPSVTILPGQAGSGDEGTAMLEIVHDLAPGSDLLFATATAGQASFAANVQALRTAGADVIVDDIFYLTEGVFQDDDVAAAVDAVAADGALYFSAAGNAGNLDDGTSGVWEGEFVASTTTIGGSPAHDFNAGGGGGPIPGDTIVQDSPFGFFLQWGDPLGGSGNDYDLVLLDAGFTTVLDASTDTQNGNDDPFEYIDSRLFNDTGLVLAVIKFAGADRPIHLNTVRGRLAVATDGQTSGHPTARGAFGVAAVDVDDAGGAGGVFDGSESVELFSSDGPRRVLYEADGSEITPGNVTMTGGELRDKPDLTAADCVSTSTPGFETFCGTSAAAPHVAAVAALLLEHAALSGATLTDVEDALRSTALDIEGPGVDRNSGAGIVDALAAGQLLAAVECDNAADDDGDGLTDFPADPGCDDALDPSENSGALPCDDGMDNDGDTWADFPADPGCGSVFGIREDPACQDGVNNDGEIGTDFDAGVSVLGAGGADPDGPDPNCIGQPARNRERPKGCGLGFELAAGLVATHALRRRRGRNAPCPRV